MRYIKIIVTLAIISLIFNTQKSLQAGDSIIIFQDNFNRADSETLGDPWTEMNEGYDYYIDDSDYPVGPGYIEIKDNAFALHTNQNPICDTYSPCWTAMPYSYAFASLEQPVTGLPLTISMNIQPHRGERIGQSMGFMLEESGFRSYTKVPNDYYLPKQGFGVFVFRGASDHHNSRMEIYQFDIETDEKIILVQGNLPFQIEDIYEYDWHLTLNNDFTISAEMNSPQGTFSLTSEAIEVDYKIDQLYMSTISSDPGPGGYSEEPFILKFDNILVTMDSENMCEPFNDDSPGFCPPVVLEPAEVYLPLIYGCNLNDSGCLYPAASELMD